MGTEVDVVQEGAAAVQRPTRESRRRLGWMVAGGGAIVVAAFARLYFVGAAGATPAPTFYGNGGGYYNEGPFRNHGSELVADSDKPIRLIGPNGKVVESNVNREKPENKAPVSPSASQPTQPGTKAKSNL